jgi:hypothetical protein
MNVAGKLSSTNTQSRGIDPVKVDDVYSKSRKREQERRINKEGEGRVA